MISWDNATEPPLTKSFTNEQLMSLVLNRETSCLYNNQIFCLPCHTQAVERCVKVVSDSSSKVTGQNSRHGMIKTKFSSRKKFSKFDTKKEYKV